ncbi:Crp/Fnr family transcriptional regulator [Cohnella herbarum]|uniref:Crp/Fnr family transcriptional regulator n=1 Tax=Cohnella herbarum TaxID=2728023 RepID=A0A7Z2ZMA3_9BACL|nr:Crp/Fnr family transcriptional regulator [Cohnella herbarum]QJD83917.1 Crp/Fnr family transcriptional regulator [Cohnella herbarum]
MTIVGIENVRVEMRVGRDVYSGTGAKLFAAGTILTKENIQMLRRHNVKKIEVDESWDSAGEIRKKSLYASKVRARDESSVHPYQSTIRHIPLFANLTDDQARKFASRFTLEKHRAQTNLFREGDPCTSLLVVLSGSVMLFNQSPHGGVDSISSLLKPGDSFGELEFIEGDPRSVAAQTLADTEIISLTRENFSNVMRSDSNIARIVMKEMNNRIYSAKPFMDELAGMDPRSRVVNCLVKLTNHFGKRTNYSIEVDMPLEMNELAQMAGVKLNELHEVLGRLEEKRFLKMHAHYFAINLQQMRV